jgi:hypothetical protein
VDGTDLADAALLDEVERACTRAREVTHGTEDIPTREVPGLCRVYERLESRPEHVTDWQKFLPELTRGDGFWPRLAVVAEKLRDDEQVEGHVGFAREDNGARAVALWQNVLEPLIRRYGTRHPDWSFDAELSAQLLSEWRQTHRVDAVWHRAIAPLHNLTGPQDAVTIRPNLQIRPLTDDDRAAIWRSFGGTHWSPIAPTVSDLELWTHAADLRWAVPVQNPRSYEEGQQAIADLVTALRLHHPGITGTTVLWTRLDPPDAPYGRSWTQETLFAPHGTGLYADPHRCTVSADDALALRQLTERVHSARSERVLALALRRFDRAYERHEVEDSLIDLWVAFEALLLPDTYSELRYRAALRIARLVGETASAREEAFGQARHSYDIRSKVVHGSAEPPADLTEALEQTRDLARRALKAWLLNRPAGGVQGLDRQLLT